MLALCGPEKAAFIAMQALFNSFTFEAALASIAVRIGRMVEDEVRFSRFKEMHGDYYRAIQEDFRRKGTRDYRFKHRVLTHKANEHQDQWIEWTPTERAEIGMKLIDLVLTHTGLLEKRSFNQHGKTKVQLVPTASATAWIEQHNEFAKLLFPDKMPCVIPPDNWTALDQGGFYSPELRSATPMVKVTSKRHKRAMEGADLSLVMDALNIVQATSWNVNVEILSIVKAVWANNLSIGMPQKDPLTVPPSPVTGKAKDALTEREQEQLADWKHEAAEIYTQEKERISKAFQATRIIWMADEFQNKANFWFVWYADFRGRLYAATSGFSPQGPDLAKGLLQFAEGKPLGPDGWYWLRIHGANRFGFDKASFEERVAWVDTNRDAFVAAANDPLAHTELWSKADKPWQFLAFLFEYRDCIALQALGRSHAEFVSRLAVGLDGSCNGLQNFSAALRDEIGGKATNLVPAELPSDIYSEVAKVCTTRLYGLVSDIDNGEMARQWVEFCTKNSDGVISRSMAKRPVMTLPYGATRQSCTKYIFESILSADSTHFASNFQAAVWLTPHMWESIGEVVVAARDAMAWLQKCSAAVSKENAPMIWETPDGFRVFQGSRVIDIMQIETQLAGRCRLNVGIHTDDIDTNKQRRGVAPNFVHSLDASHLRETVRRAAVQGITSLAVIHDDYGTHAADTGKLYRIIREAFVALYSDHDPFDAFRVAHEAEGRELPPMPPRGALQIADVMQSRYFFA